MLEIQKYLLSGKSVTNLKDELGIKANSHYKYNNLIGFKYDQIDSPAGHPIVREARGLILDSEDDWKVVAHPFNRFYNYGEGHADTIDWSSATVSEKVDGSICILYHYKDEWHVATSGNPSASGMIGAYTPGKWNIGDKELPKPKTFAEYFWQVMNEKYTFPDNLPTNHCFMFELMGSMNRIVVLYKEPKLALLGGRNLTTGKELTLVEAGQCIPNIPTVKTFNLSNIEDILFTFDDMSPLSQEGYVVVDKNFNRIKIKSPAYIALHHSKSNFTFKTIVTIALRGESSEVIAAFPEYKDDFMEVQRKIEELVLDINNTYLKVKHIENQKEFALAIKHTKIPSALFQMRSGKVSSAKEYLNNININRVINFLGY